MSLHLVLVSHVLCPYVQRVAIALREKGIACERRDIDLAHKPSWFLALSPTGKTPLLLAGETPIFESSVICEYLEDIQEPRLHPADPLRRASHRAWMEFASLLLDTIGGLYSARDEAALADKADVLRGRLRQVEQALGTGPWFGGAAFSLVDAAFAPALRYFDVIDDAGFGFFDGLPKLVAWRERLAVRPSVQQAVSPGYRERLHAFLLTRGSALGERLRHVSLPRPLRTG